MIDKFGALPNRFDFCEKEETSLLLSARLHGPIDNIKIVKKTLKAREVTYKDGVVFLCGRSTPITVVAKEFQVNVLSSDIIYENENLSNTTDAEIQYDSDSVSDSGNSFENENEEHSDIPTASGTESLFLVGGLSKFGRTIRYNSNKFL